MNTLAYDINMGIIDLFGGISNINNGIIRTVSDSDEKFQEDALGMLRVAYGSL